MTDPSPFHADELTAQALAQQSSPGTGIRPFMPDQHREFFAGLPYLFIATADRDGWPVASILTGAQGFVHSPDATTLRIDALPAAADPVAPGLHMGGAIGLLGLDLSNRRRNRANGTVRVLDATGFTVAITQSFGNCAQYIQTRMPAPHAVQFSDREDLTTLDADAVRAISGADTFFVASRSRDGLANGSAAGGLDMSHRGGRPGFVGISDSELRIPDFRGNRFFNTLGNLLGEPRAGLLFVDFETGDLLLLQGRVTIDWSPSGDLPAGTQRVWRVAVERGWRRRKALPFGFKFSEFAPTTLATGSWA